MFRAPLIYQGRRRKKVFHDGPQLGSPQPLLTVPPPGNSVLGTEQVKRLHRRPGVDVNLGSPSVVLAFIPQDLSYPAGIEFGASLAGDTPGPLETLATQVLTGPGALEFADVVPAVTVPIPTETLVSQISDQFGWVEFGNAVPAVTGPGPLEIQAAQYLLSAIPAEFLGTLTADGPEFVESQAIQLRGLGPPIEFAALASVALPIADEILATQAPLAAIPSEFLASAASVTLAFLENAATVAPNISAWTEFQIVVPAVTAAVQTEILTTQGAVSAGTLEFSAILQANPFAPLEWLTVSITDNAAAQLEFAANPTFNISVPFENLSLAVTVSATATLTAQIEFQHLLGVGLPVTAEWLAVQRVDAAAQLEAMPTAQQVAPAPVEFVASLALPAIPQPLEFTALFQGLKLVPAEWSALLFPSDQRVAAEWSATLSKADAPLIEFMSPMVFTDLAVFLEFGASLLGSLPAGLEWARTVAAMQRSVTLEWVSNILSGDVPTWFEWGGLVLPISSNVPLEMLLAALNISPAGIEWLGSQIYPGAVGVSSAPLEFGSVVSPIRLLLPYERLSGVASDPDLAVPLEWLALRPPPILNLRPGRLRSGGTVNRPAPFAPIDVGETDNFGFDFSNQVGAATIIATSWTCRAAPFQTIIDLVPQSHILSSGAHRMVSSRSIIDDTLIIKSGAFSVASIGGFAPPSMGGTYILEATANLSNGRILQLSATVTCRGRNG